MKRGCSAPAVVSVQAWACVLLGSTVAGFLSRPLLSGAARAEWMFALGSNRRSYTLECGRTLRAKPRAALARMQLQQRQVLPLDQQVIHPRDSRN